MLPAGSERAGLVGPVASGWQGLTPIRQCAGAAGLVRLVVNTR